MQSSDQRPAWPRTHPATGRHHWARDRNAAVLLLSLCLALAAALTAYRFLTSSPEREARLDQRYSLSEDATYSLSALRIFSDVLQRVRDTYVDPTRIVPRSMLLGALEALQEEVPEVIVRLRDDGQQVTVQVGAYQRSFAVHDADSLHMLYRRIKEIVGFLERHIQRTTEIREVEYAAINGALSTLDPHSVLWDPHTYREMKVGTRGSFGGLGIVIAVRGGVLTVISPIDGTPATKAGIKAGDRIIRIGSESTVNMTLNEAVNRLRGEPGTKVSLLVERDGDPSPRHYEILRDVIKWKTVESRVLEGRIGYLRIKHFSRTTARDLESHLEGLNKQGVVGLVVDLYNNPGGLLDQAIRVADLFLDAGVIVTTVGNAGKQREEKRAGPLSLVGALPMVVLASSGSASASEIVVGALKNLDRAVMIGDSTFGKGSVQVLYDNRDGSALKLTVAQYLTPGDISIQSTGITPDIQMIPVKVDKPRISYFAAGSRRREEDLDAHLDPSRQEKREQPVAVLRYLESTVAPDESDPEDAGGGADPRVINLARDLLVQGFGHKRSRVLRLAREFLTNRTEREHRHIAKALLALGIDWSVQAPASLPMLETDLELDPSDGVVQAGSSIKVKVTVSNLGLGNAYRVRAISTSASPALKDLEFFFGRIAPGASLSQEITVQIPADARSAVWKGRLRFAEEYGHQPPDQRLRLRLVGHPRAVFAAQHQVIDLAPGGNGDGLAQWGESLRLRLTVRNIGPGASTDTVATLKNLSGPEVFLHSGRGRLKLGTLLPGQEVTGEFTFDLKRRGVPPSVSLQLTVFDNHLGEGVEQRIVVPVSRRSRAVSDEQGYVEVTSEEARITVGADPRTPVLALAPQGTLLPVTGRAGDRLRVQIGLDWPGFVSAMDTKPVPAPPMSPPPPRLHRQFQLTPPLIALERYPLSTGASEVVIQGAAYDDTQIQDVFVQVHHPQGKPATRKVFFQSNRGGANPKLLRFQTPVPLREGLNTISVVAREDHHVRTTQTIVVLRESAAGALSALQRHR